MEKWVKHDFSWFFNQFSWHSTYMYEKKFSKWNMCVEGAAKLWNMSVWILSINECRMLHLFMNCEHTVYCYLGYQPTEILLAGGVNENEDLGGLATLK